MALNQIEDATTRSRVRIQGGCCSSKENDSMPPRRDAPYGRSTFPEADKSAVIRHIRVIRTNLRGPSARRDPSRRATISEQRAEHRELENPEGLSLVAGVWILKDSLTPLRGLPRFGRFVTSAPLRGI